MKTSDRYSHEMVYTFVRQNVPLRVHEGDFYICTEEGYKRISNKNLLHLIRSLYSEYEQALLKDKVLKEIIENLSNDPCIQIQIVDLDVPEVAKYFIPMRNGIFDLRSRNLIKYTDFNGIFSYFVDAEYIPKEKRNCPAFLEFISKSFPVTLGRNCSEEENRKFFSEQAMDMRRLLEFLGALVSNVLMKMAFLLVGAANSGKSVICGFVEDCIKPDNLVSHVELDHFTNKFGRNAMKTSKVNISTELSKKCFQKASAVFKALTSRETIEFERKFCDVEEFRPRVNLLMASNMMPDMEPESVEAMLSRLVIMPFPASVPLEEQDTSMRYRLWLERNSIWSEAVDAYTDAMYCANGRFTSSNRVIKLYNDILFESPRVIVDEFLNGYTVPDKDGFISSKVLFDAFMRFCDENLIDWKFKGKKFSSMVLSLPYIGSERDPIDPRKRGFKGIRLKDAASMVEETGVIASMNSWNNPLNMNFNWEMDVEDYLTSLVSLDVTNNKNNPDKDKEDDGTKKPLVNPIIEYKTAEEYEEALKKVEADKKAAYLNLSNNEEQTAKKPLVNPVIEHHSDIAEKETLEKIAADKKVSNLRPSNEEDEYVDLSKLKSQKRKKTS